MGFEECSGGKSTVMLQNRYRRWFRQDAHADFYDFQAQTTNNRYQLVNYSLNLMYR
ncbi:hypothetical protein RA086_07645 [Lactiplantibacillus sp. WILCCON 0030]|uniref:Uncharacterized protein n=1 Tax=Lactiplantibacillus brownii TaxID=3069269 RepID=A0ABU1A9F7_9LACO|nr:hypothetical protein [Lactiplantibacillus brownii]MDQ7937501.1 hypothetical protein [Lactiplantibacillus brownii]